MRRGLDEDCWFKGGTATVRAVVQHVRQIQEADFSLPVILSSDGLLLDGMHRVAEAVLSCDTGALAQHLSCAPDPDWYLQGATPHRH